MGLCHPMQWACALVGLAAALVGVEAAAVAAQSGLAVAHAHAAASHVAVASGKQFKKNKRACLRLNSTAEKLRAKEVAEIAAGAAQAAAMAADAAEANSNAATEAAETVRALKKSLKALRRAVEIGKEQVVWAKVDKEMSFEEAKQFAKLKGGRLLFTHEAQQILKKGPIYTGEDAWAPCIPSNNIGAEWIQMGDKYHPAGSTLTSRGGEKQVARWERGDFEGYSPRYLLFYQGQGVVRSNGEKEEERKALFDDVSDTVKQISEKSGSGDSAQKKKKAE